MFDVWTNFVIEMKQDIEIHPRMESLRREIERVPEHTYRVLHTYCNKRNTVELAEIGGVMMVVKRFKRPNLINSLIYGRFRPGKARRSYDNALRLPRLGVLTPEPVAYITRRKGLLFTDSWYISMHVDAPPIGDTVTEADRTRMDTLFEQNDMLRAFRGYALSLFERGVFQRDFNRGNFLAAPRDNGGYEFYMVDINRLQFRQLTAPLVAISWVRFGADLTPGLIESLTTDGCRSLGYDEHQAHRAARAMTAKGARREARRQVKRWLRRKKQTFRR